MLTNPKAEGSEGRRITVDETLHVVRKSSSFGRSHVLAA